MTINKKNFKELGFVEAYYGSIPVYFKDLPGEESCEVVGRGWFWDLLLTASLWINFNIRGDEGMYFYIPLICNTDEECPAGTYCLENHCHKKDNES